MRVTLLHNKSAGSENHADHEIEASLRRAGHEVVSVVAKLEELISTIRSRPCELIVLAGGDGTVSRAACALAGCQVPLAILPLGTANNTARSLGVGGEIDELVASWAQSRLYDFDLATISEGDKLAPFSEAVGWGIFPRVIAEASRLSSPDETADTLERDRRLFQTVIENAAPRPYELTIDGEELAGEYLLVEVVNIPLIGPQLEVSPASNPSDGLLELVLAGESERTLLLELARGGRIGSDVKLPTRQVTHVSVRTEDANFHRDGSLVARAENRRPFAIAVEPASVKYLLGAERPKAGAAAS